MKALVTGASRGLGRAIAKRLAADGFEVWVGFLECEDEAEATLDEIRRAGGAGRTVRFDVSDSRAVDSVLVPLLASEGPVDVLVNNAGVAHDGYMMMLPEAKWREVLDVNLTGFFLVTRACLKGMVQRKRGRIVNVGSLAGEIGNVGQVAYAASKAGIAGATRALALEMARWNILVNAVSPGPLDTGMASGTDASKLLERIPLARLGNADEVAGAVSFLCSKDASYVTGQVIPVNGGMGM
ncbi:MAG: 3-oxoacyl-ACP reductase FabG [Deltaproteobacteria bacterium]|nr:3-oxoacyl-ACP reductase FabG [Deltaproteobacteria bacterium]